MNLGRCSVDCRKFGFLTPKAFANFSLGFLPWD
jgi:hypothetical protein